MSDLQPSLATPQVVWKKLTGKIVAYPNPLPGGLVAKDAVDFDGNICYSTADRIL